MDFVGNTLLLYRQSNNECNANFAILNKRKVRASFLRSDAAMKGQIYKIVKKGGNSITFDEREYRKEGEKTFF